MSLARSRPLRAPAGLPLFEVGPQSFGKVEDKADQATDRPGDQPGPEGGALKGPEAG